MHTKEMLPLPVKPRARASYVHRGIPRVTVPPPEIKHLPSMYRPRPVTVVKSHVVSTKHKQENKPKQVAAGKVTATKPRRNAKPRRKLALLLPGHNEELIISTTIRSAVAAGQNKRDIFVVDDASTDATRRLAVELLGKQNVLSVHRSGKALAVKKAIKKFNIERQYQWLHVADADSIFSPDYFRIYRRKLDSSKYAVAVGFVQSLRGNWISTYRALTYTFSQHVNRRIQAKLGMISVFPGPITCFRTDILSKLDFEADSMTEDFDITLQVHRKKLGNIVFIPRVRKYRIGLHGQRIDLSLGFQMLQTILFIVQLGILFPLIIFTTHNWMIIPVAIAADFVLNSAIAVGASVAAKRWMLLGALPYFYFLRWVEIGIYLSAFVEVIILGRFKQSVKGWATEGRRYKLDMAALQDVAQ
jgi:hypothetical protein